MHKGLSKKPTYFRPEVRKLISFTFSRSVTGVRATRGRARCQSPLRLVLDEGTSQFSVYGTILGAITLPEPRVWAMVI